MDAATSFKMLSNYATIIVLAMLGTFFCLISYRLFTGAINTKGMLADKSGGGVSPARAQLCLLSIGGAFYYLMMVVEVVQAGATPDLNLPAPPKELLALVLGSNTVYVTAKAASAARRLGGILSSLR
ncbi:MAG: hypothetical protein M3Y86_01615 [Verrucomicrobiota bacterium]|nr:hypothetical protein [Verrucomicrobiota bacterium]